MLTVILSSKLQTPIRVLRSQLAAGKCQGHLRRSPWLGVNWFPWACFLILETACRSSIPHTWCGMNYDKAIYPRGSIERQTSRTTTTSCLSFLGTLSEELGLMDNIYNWLKASLRVSGMSNSGAFQNFCFVFLFWLE